MAKVDAAGLSRKNLNLLIVFDVVAELRSVTLAAEQLSLSQSALSHALGRLRTLLGDPLFVRGRNELVLTARAEALVHPVRALLSTAEDILKLDIFDPASSNREFRIGLSECCIVLLGRQAMQQVRLDAPGAKIIVETFDQNSERRIREGFLDIAVWHADVPAQSLCSTELFLDNFVGTVHAAHPLAEKARANSISVGDYFSYPHIQTILQGIHRDRVSSALSRLGKQRSIAINTKTFTPSFPILVGSPLIATVPSRLAVAAQAFCPDLITFKLPFDIDPLPYRMVWDQRTDADEAVTWLRSVILRMVPEALGIGTANVDGGHITTTVR